MAAWKKTFVSAFVAQIFSIVGFTFMLPFLPFFVGELGVEDQARWSGYVLSAAGVTLALFAPLWGVLADRYGRKAMVMRAMFGGTIVMIAMSFVQTVQQLIVCRLLQGALTGTVAASVALVASVTPPRRAGFALGMMQTAVFVGVSIGPLLGGMVADLFGYRLAFRIGAVVIFFGGWLVHFGTHEDFSRPDPEDESNNGGFRKILFSSGFLAAVFVLFSIRFSNTLSNPAFPLVVEDILGPSPRLNSITGMIFCSAALAGAVTAALLGHFGDSWGHKRVLIVCSAATGIVSLAHAYAYSIGYLLVARTLFGLTVAGMIPAGNALIRHCTDLNSIGKAYGAATSISMAGLALGPFLGGLIAQNVGLRTPFVVTGLCQILVVGIVVAFVSDHRAGGAGDQQ